MNFTLLDSLDYASVLVFALTGALAASRSQLDIVGFIFIASLTALGGGTLRDALLHREIFWVDDPLTLAVATLAAVLVFFAAHLLESRYRALLWFDAAALAVAVPAGRHRVEMVYRPPLARVGLLLSGLSLLLIVALMVPWRTRWPGRDSTLAPLDRSKETGDEEARSEP